MKRYATLAVTPILAAILSQLTPAQAQNIPQQSGSYSVAARGTIVSCLNPSTNNPEACTTSGVQAAPSSFIEVGHITYASGVGCEEDIQVINSEPANASPPIVVNNATAVVKYTSYDPSTGIGTASFTGYIGGSCSGTNFNSNGATVNVTGTLGIVVTEGGRRAELVITELQNAAGSVGGVSVSITDLKQTP